MTSRNGTMESGVSAQAFHHQQQNLQQLQNLENNFQHSRSLTSSERKFVPEHVINSQVVENIQHAQQRNTQQSLTNSDPRNPFNITLPINSNPPEILASRFLAWISITKSLIDYLNDVASIQEEVVRQQQRLRNSYKNPVYSLDKNASTGAKQNPHTKEKTESYQPNFFLAPGNGSIQDLPQILKHFHTSAEVLADKTVKEIRKIVIPRLDDLRKDLSSKTREIRSLSSDFKNSVAKEASETKADLQRYLKAIEDSKFSPQSVQPKNDPHLLKIILDRQIKKQLVEENYLHDAFINLQSSAKELEKVVVIEIQNALTVYAKLLGEQAQNVFDQLIRNLDLGFLTKQPTFEWDQFIARDKNFIDENTPKRSFKDIQYEKQNDPLALEIRSSFLERRSKFLKSYSRAYYVLTPTFFHEFKTSDRKRDLIPVMSLSIDDIELDEHSKRETNQNKFVIKKVGKLSSNKLIFRAESYESMLAWYNDIKNLKSLNSPTSRGVYAQKHHTQEKTQISRVTTNTSKITNSINNDTILTIPNNNQVLPPHSNSPLPQTMAGPNGVYYKEVGGNGSGDFSTSSPQQFTVQQPQRQSMPPPHAQIVTAQQRYSLQYPPQQQINAPYPTQQPFLDPRYVSEQQEQQQSGYNEGQFLDQQSIQPQVPGVYIEAPPPQPQSDVQSTPQQTNGARKSFESFPHSNAPEPDGSGFSEDTVKSNSAKKETHTDDDDLYQQSYSRLSSQKGLKSVDSSVSQNQMRLNSHRSNNYE